METASGPSRDKRQRTHCKFEDAGNETQKTGDVLWELEKNNAATATTRAPSHSSSLSPSTYTRRFRHLLFCLPQTAHAPNAAQWTRRCWVRYLFQGLAVNLRSRTWVHLVLVDKCTVLREVQACSRRCYRVGLLTQREGRDGWSRAQTRVQGCERQVWEGA